MLDEFLIVLAAVCGVAYIATLIRFVMSVRRPRPIKDWGADAFVVGTDYGRAAKAAR